MTGFARSSGQSGPQSWAWEIRSVNGKSLDVRIKLPPSLDGLDPLLRGVAARMMARGNVQASLEITRDRAEAAVTINQKLLEALSLSVDKVAASLGKPPPSLDTLLNVRGVIEIVEAQQDEQHFVALRDDVTAGFVDALESLVAARREEGIALAALLSARLREVRHAVAAARVLPGRQPEAIQARLSAQIAALRLEPLDPARLHQEAVLIAVKADIQEELDRLDAHVESGLAMLADGAPVGRRLDFLCQELNRETNTLCAKSNDVALTRIGLGLKTLVEQIREQVQNVE